MTCFPSTRPTDRRSVYYIFSGIFNRTYIVGYIKGLFILKACIGIYIYLSFVYLNLLYHVFFIEYFISVRFKNNSENIKPF